MKKELPGVVMEAPRMEMELPGVEMEAPRMEMDGPRMEMGGPTLEMERPIPGAGGPSGLPHDPAPSLRDAAACHGPHETEERTIVAGSIYRGVEASGGVPGAGQREPFAIVQ